MADAQMSPEQAMEMQKQNCIFCKIVSGAMESKKVYEDEKMLAILDINPANKGHVLVMPKEHYPILPLIPPETFSHLFSTTQKLMSAMRTALIVPRISLFIANGGVAGQRSPHFLYHLIPREEGDGLDALDLEQHTTEQTQTIATFGPKIQALLQRAAPTAQLAKQPATAQQPSVPPSQPPAAVPPPFQPAPEPQPSAPAPAPAAASPPPFQPAPEPQPTTLTPAPQPVPTTAEPARMDVAPQTAAPDKPTADAFSQFASDTPPPPSTAPPAHPPPRPVTVAPQEQAVPRPDAREQLAMVLQQNPGLKDLIIRVPDQVATYVKGSPELSVLFEGIDIHALSAKLRQQQETGEEAVPVPPPSAQEPPADQQSVEQPAEQPVEAAPETQAAAPGTEDVPDAAKLDDQQLLAFLAEKPQLKELLLSDPEQLEAMKKTNMRVAAFFRTVSPAAVAARARNSGMEADGVDFDALSQHLSK